MPPLPPLLLLLLLSSLQLLSSTYTPPDKYFIDCGSGCNTTVSDGRIFVGDLNPPFAFSPGESKHVRDSNLSNNTPSLYHTARIFRDPSSYDLEVDHNGKYMVRLHFFPFSSPINLSDAMFEVWADSSSFNLSASAFQLLSNFSVSDGSLPVIEEFLLSINEGKFSLYFVPSQKPSSSFAFVNAIEVFLVPDHFISDSAAGSNGNYSDLLSHVFHTIHRINVGGSKIRPDDDILWRNWVPGDKYLINPVAAMNSQFYSKELNASCTKRVNVSSLTWHFPVNKNVMQHLVRVHFCNMICQAPSLLELFISVNGQFKRMIKTDSTTNDLSTPFYVDFVVDSDGFEFVDIGIALLPENLAYCNTFLDGLEIFEIQKKSGALLIQGQPMKMNQSAADGSYFGFVMVMGIIVLIPDLKRRKAKLAKEESNSRPQDSQAERNEIISVASQASQAVRNKNIPIPWDIDHGSKISFAEILKATKKFDSKFLIGKCRFGKVYKGILQGTKVAVKRYIPRDKQGFMEFETEIMVCSRIRHRHLVPLIGYCDETSEKILIFEYMEQGTLRDHLYGYKKMHSKLSWEDRLEICIGVAKGLHHLHAGSDVEIIHRDVKSINILLDENYVAKVVDFGLSIICGSDEEVTPFVVGTLGYLDPEYMHTSQCTTKSDVYSFGVVLLEVLCARPPIIHLSDGAKVSLIEWATNWERKVQLTKVIDPVLKGEADPDSLRVVGDIVVKCLESKSAERPTMQEVEQRLIEALKLQQNAGPIEHHEDNTTSHSGNIALPSAQYMPFEENLAARTATISISPNLKISLAEIKEATNNFDARLLIAESGFGKVYKGTLKGISVAVKRSELGHDQGFLGFQREIMVFSQIQNRHIVSFIGYCDERSEMILIYELMENSTLRDYLYNSKGKTERASTQPNLSWGKRLEICIGAANGLHYLHTGFAEGIIHHDVKAANILLDEHFVAKVADFGISQLGPLDPAIHFSLLEKGTIGFVDPEILILGEFTTKSDVYAFGVLLLEVICARPAIIASSQREEINLAEWGMLWQRKGQLEKIMDPVLVGDTSMSSLRVVGETAEKCLKQRGADRPTMQEVELQLKYALELQQSAVQRVSYEDCSTSASMESALPNVQHMPSYSFHVGRDDVSIQVDDDFYSLGGDEAPDSLGGDEAPDSLGGDDASDSFFSAKSSPDNMV
ncbi:hypothetical protein UlMin_039141 [Ulmus minor]